MSLEKDTLLEQQAIKAHNMNVDFAESYLHPKEKEKRQNGTEER